MEVLYPRCAGLDVHSRCVNACVRIAAGRKVTTEHREFATTTAGLLELAAWLTEAGCTHVAMEATGVYWKPVWHVLEVLHPAVPDPRIHETGYRVGAWRWPRGRFLYGAKSPFFSWTRSPASTPYCETGDSSGERAL